ncbi:MAG: UDP-3-O-acyl-N-acetylglucosamine deacetylase [Spirochaetota bacterium]|nr:UDP-3-O-acyl-N-acetylglucosamine deacetylase [Spirochaetota bacterium]
MSNLNITSRKTIEDVIYTEGIGIHSGDLAKIRLLPANVDSGIIFINKKYGMKSPIKGNVESIVDTTFAITLGNSKWKVATVEHLMASLLILGVTDVIIEIDGDEMPIFDGSAKPIIELFNEKRFHHFEKEVNPIKIINPIWVMDGEKLIIALPSEEPRISYTINYEQSFVQTQYAHFPLSQDVVLKEIAPARTYGFEKDVEYLHRCSYALGGSLNNALVISDDSYLNQPRFVDECVRHKVLDFLGDIAFIGRPLVAYFIVCMSGHTFDVSFAKKIVDIYSNIEVGTIPDIPFKAKKKV